MKKPNDHTYMLSLTVRNRPGVLVRCAQVFGRRGHNIEAVEVKKINDQPDLAIMTFTAYGQPQSMDQIMAQLDKLIDVQSVTEKELS